MGLFDWLKAEPAPAQAPALAELGAPTPEQIAAALARVDDMVAGGKVPAPVAVRVHRVTRTLRETLPRMKNAGLDSADEYSVIATATDYLPEALGAYVRLPRDWADSRPIEGGKTSLLLLVDQLDLLARTTDRMYDAVLQADATALILHGRFLQEKFGQPPTTPPAPPARGRTSTASRNPLDLEAL